MSQSTGVLVVCYDEPSRVLTRSSGLSIATAFSLSVKGQDGGRHTQKEWAFEARTWSTGQTPAYFVPLMSFCITSSFRIVARALIVSAGSCYNFERLLAGKAMEGERILKELKTADLPCGEEAAGAFLKRATVSLSYIRA